VGELLSIALKVFSTWMCIHVHVLMLFCYQLNAPNNIFRQLGWGSRDAGMVS
jgi:hypothetical protein